MVSVGDHQSADIPSKQLGWHFSSWTRADIRTILDLYEEVYIPKASKLELFWLLDGVITRHALTRRDRIIILNARKAGSPLPAAKPTVATNKSSMVEQETTDAPMTTTNTQPSDVSEELALLETAEQNTSSENEDVGPEVEALFTQKVSALQVPTLECSVCYETMNNSNTPQRKTTRSCNHNPDVCLSCLSNSIATQFTSKTWDRIDCPSCDERLDYHDIKLFADSVSFGRYDNYSLEACLNDGQFQRCRVAGCSSGQQTFPEDDSYMICRECHGRTCLTCDAEWHPDVTCADNAPRRAHEKTEEEAAAGAYIDANAKLCPNCNVRGEKVSGCDHMTCPRCSYQYCWRCLADYADVRRLGNTGHRDDCQYHTNNLPDTPVYEA